MPMPAWLRQVLLGPETGDGFGQSIADDLRFLHRFRACRRQPIAWREPCDVERKAIDAHPIVGCFGDWTIGIADVDGRRWIVRDRDWFGWPDPPEYVFFALEGDTIWAGADFHNWPRAWTRP